VIWGFIFYLYFYFVCFWRKKKDFSGNLWLCVVLVWIFCYSNNKGGGYTGRKILISVQWFGPTQSIRTDLVDSEIYKRAFYGFEFKENQFKGRGILGSVFILAVYFKTYGVSFWILWYFNSELHNGKDIKSKFFELGFWNHCEIWFHTRVTNVI